MRSKNPLLKTRILNYINTYHFNRHRMPTLNEIAEKLCIAKSTAQRYLSEMHNEGMLSYRAGVISTSQVDQLSFSHTNAPLLGYVSCGEPFPAEQEQLDFVPLPIAIFGSDDLFLLKASGDSMIDVGVSSGDIVVVRRQRTARTGDIVVALVDGHETTLKRLMYDNQQQCSYLHPENEEFEDMYFNDIEIQGIMVNVIKLGPF